MSIGNDTFIHNMLSQMGLQSITATETRYPSLSPDARILPVRGDYFSWYGSRLKDAPAYFESILKQIALSD